MEGRMFRAGVVLRCVFQFTLFPGVHFAMAEPTEQSSITAAPATHSAVSASASTDQLLQMMVNCSIGSLTNLQRAIDISLEGISEWIATPKNRRQIANLVTLLDAQAQLLVCQHRVGAIVRLAEVASRDAKPEVVRRACADLLKIRLIDPYQEDRRPEKMPPQEPKTREQIQEEMFRRQEENDWMINLMMNGASRDAFKPRDSEAASGKNDR
jgi:hypothetical protein